uniref:Uncharacterized protein n=1 Tax=Oryza barthii TaxID=65489 RepID=A0A0D3F0E8_9ORYZ
MAAIHALHTLRRSSMAMQTSITEIAAGLDKGGNGNYADNTLSNAHAAEGGGAAATRYGATFSAIVPFRGYSRGNGDDNVLSTAIAPPGRGAATPRCCTIFADVVCIQGCGSAALPINSWASTGWGTIKSVAAKGDYRVTSSPFPSATTATTRHLQAATAITLRGARRRGESRAAPPAWDLGGPRKPYFRVAITACAAHAMRLLVAPSSMHGSGVLPLCDSGWGPPELGCGRIAGTTNIILDLFFFPNNVWSRDVKGLIIGDESRCQDNHRVQTSLQLEGELLPKEEGKGTRMTWVTGTPQPPGMAYTAAQGRAVSKEGWRCYGQNSAPLIIR